MKVAIADIRKIMGTVLAARGYGTADAEFITTMYLGGELRGHTSHGLASFPGFAKQDFSHLDQPVVLRETHAMYVLDAQSNPGTIVGRRAADEAMRRAKAEGTGVAIIKNMDSWLRPGAIAEYIADQGLVAVVMNSGGGRAVAPPGGFDAVTGTNPIAYGLPTGGGPLVVDMATAKRAWGQVRLANKYGTNLPADAFYDDHGNVTVDPARAWSVMPFGDYKGFSLALLVEIMCGSMVGMDMMVASGGGNKYGEKMPERGAVIWVIDPGQTTDAAQFQTANSEYLHNIKATRSLPGQAIRIPGDEATAHSTAAVQAGYIDLPAELWQEIQAL